MTPRIPRWAPLLGVAGLLAAAWLGRSTLGIEWDVESVRGLVSSWGVWGPLVFILLLALRFVVMIPSQVLLIAAGLCFGTAAGTLYGALGVTLSGCIVFGVTRWLGSEVVRAQIPPRLQGRIDAVGRRTVAAISFAATAYPVGPLHAIHAGAALTAVAPAAFLVAVAGGATVRAATYTYFGSSIAEGDASQFALAGAAILAVALLPLLFPASRRWLLAQLLRGRDPRGIGGGLRSDERRRPPESSGD